MTDWTPAAALDELRTLLPIEDEGPAADFREITGPEVGEGDLPIAELVSLAIDKPVSLAGIDGTYGGKRAFRGGWTCECVALSLPRIERAMIQRGIIKHSIDIWQLGYRTDVRASAGTHAGGCMVDVGQYSDAALRVWREYGWTMQHRTRAQGFSMDHGHGGPYGCWHGSDYADYQQREYEAGRNGLISRGPVTGPTVPLIRWDTALKERWDEVATVTEIKDAVRAVVREEVNRDAVKPPAYALAADPANKAWRPWSFLTPLLDLAKRNDAEVKALRAELAELAARLTARSSL